jgi:hypothetical protein
MFNLLNNGDNNEREAYPLFIKDRFPSYEIFWQKFIVQLTNRVENHNDINLTIDSKLIARFPLESIEKIHERMAISQLHYSALIMLLKAYKQIAPASKNLDSLENCFSHLYSALDISAELFARYERLKNNLPITDDSFDPITSVDQSKKIRRDWQRNKYPADIEDIRHYRNMMLHGQMFACSATPEAGFLSLPNVGKMENYLDWRTVFESYRTGHTQDFMWSKDIAEKSFDIVVDFLEQEWKRNLI